MCSDGNDVGTAVSADTVVQVSAEQPVAVDAVLCNSNSTSVPSYQYDASGMTELSLVTDEVSTLCYCMMSVTVKFSR